jgi:glycosyltransferase involved in cell wall biosynthesis
MKLLILHDYFLYRGGGERLVMSLAKGLGATVATAFIAKDAFDPRAEGIETIELFKESRWSRLPGFRYLQVQLAFLFKTTFLKNFDVIMYSGDCLLALLRAWDKKNIAYMHTPPRHLYDQYRQRLKEYSWWKKMVFIPFAFFNRWRFKTLSKRFDCIVTNSKNTQARIKKYLGLDSLVAYPPCTTLPFKNFGTGDYFFSWARLYPIKRVALVVEAFTCMPDKKLVIASGGPDYEKIKKMAEGHPNITLLGWISDQKLIETLGKCRATIYIPVQEDFGMSAVESMAAGKPVIGVAEGGLLEIITPEVNGLLVQTNPTTSDLITAVKNLTQERAERMQSACEKTAERFSEQAFIARMKEIVATV